MSAARWVGEHLELSLRVQPCASRREISVEADGRLKIRLTAAAVDNAANAQLITLLAKELGVSRSKVTVIGGSNARTKRVQIQAPARTPAWLTQLTPIR